MAERTLFPEWRKQNETIKFPFSAAATLVNANGRTLIEGTFLDAALYPIGAVARLFMSSVVVTHQTVTIYLSTPSQKNIAVGTFDLPTPPDQIEFVDRFERPAGVIVTEGRRLSLFQSWGVGTHEFGVNATEFAATCVFPTPEIGLRGIRLESGELFVGDVWLVGDDGVVLRTEHKTIPVPGSCEKLHVNTVRVDVVGDPLFRRRLCQPSALFTTPQFLQRIEVVGPNMAFTLLPDANGNVLMTTINDLAADTVLRIVTTPEGIRFGAVGSVTNAE